jgi:RNA polymerase sigma-70 factor (ECF subfamily)
MDVRSSTDESRLALDFTDTLEAAQRGREWALAALWRAFNPRVVRFLHGRDPVAAEDIASETWIRASRSLRAFEGNEAEFRGWLFTIARRTSIDWQRRRARRPSTVTLEAVAEVADHDDPADRAAGAQELERLLGLVARLPRDQTDVVLLRIVAGLDVGAVAEVMGKRAGTVRVIQHRALRRLAEMLEAEDFGGGGVTP